MLATAPNDRHDQLEMARSEVRRLAERQEAAERSVERAHQRLAAFGPLTGLRQVGRAARATAQGELARSVAGRNEVASALATARRRAEHLDAHQQRRGAFLGQEGWRAQRVAAIDDELAHHWTRVVLAAVGQDDPLAFGIERLRSARATVAADLARLRAGLPPDRSDAIARAELELVTARRGVGGAHNEVVDSAAALDHAHQRHWGRRDRGALEMATGRTRRADDRLGDALEAERQAAFRLAKEVVAQKVRAQAVEAMAKDRAVLYYTITELDSALQATKAERVVALAAEPLAPTHLAVVIGDPPPDPTARAVWCALAAEVESYRDTHPQAMSRDRSTGVEVAIGRKPKSWADSQAWEGLAKRLAAGRDLIGIAGELSLDAEPTAAELDPATWARSLTQAEQLGTASIEVAHPELGLGLGR